jgi:hypothetical protein
MAFDEALAERLRKQLGAALRALVSVVDKASAPVDLKALAPCRARPSGRDRLRQLHLYIPVRARPQLLEFPRPQSS